MAPNRTVCPFTEQYKRRAPKKLWKHKCLVHFHTKILYDLSATKSQFGRLKICCRNLGRSLSEKRQHPKHSSRVSCHAFLWGFHCACRVPAALAAPTATPTQEHHPHTRPGAVVSLRKATACSLRWFDTFRHVVQSATNNIKRQTAPKGAWLLVQPL